MKLKVYQQGGGLIYTPFIPGQQATGTSSSSKEEDDDAKIDPLDKEILGLLKDANLLPSDIAIITNSLMSFQRRTQRLSSYGGSYRSVMPGMLQIMNQVGIAKHNREVWNDKVTEMKKHEAGSEVAMDSYGNIWTQSEDGIKKIRLSDFDPEKHKPLSNSELLYLRERNLGFSDDILGDAGMDIVGAKDLRQEIDAIINEFGTVKSEQYIAKDMRELASDIAEKGIFKVGQERSKADLQDFSKLLYLQLGDSSKHLLNARAKINGYDPIEYLRSIIFSNTDVSDQISYEKQLSDSANGRGGGSGSESLAQDNYLVQFGNLQLTEGQTAIVPHASEIGDRYGLIVQTYMSGAPMKRNGDANIGMMSINEFNQTAWGIQAGDRSSVTFGNKVLSSHDLDMIMYDGSSELNVAMLPYKRDPSGKLTPDFDKLIGFNNYKKELEKNPNMSDTEKAQILSIYGLRLSDIKEDDNGTLRIIDTIPFITYSAYASKDTTQLTDENKRFLEHLDNSDGKRIMDPFMNMLRYGTVSPDKNARKVHKFGMFDFSPPERWDMYRGNVFIPMTDSARAMLHSGIGQYVPKSQLNNYAARATIRNAEVAAHNAALADPNYDVISSLGQFR